MIKLLIILNMLFIPLFGARMIDVWVLQSNIGNFFYAFVIWGYSVLYFQGGSKLVYTTLRDVMISLTALFCVFVSLAYLPVPDGNEKIAELQGLLFDISAQIMAASYAAQIITLVVFAWVLRNCAEMNYLVSATLAMIAAQFVDSVVFFGIAFPDALKTAGLDGFLIKCVLGILGIPALWLFTRDTNPR